MATSFPGRSLIAARMRGESSGALSMYAAMKESVRKHLRADTPFTDGAIDAALDSLFLESSPHFLALPHQYIEAHEPAAIAKHVATIMAAKESARAANRPLDLNIAQEDRDTAFFAARSLISVDAASGRVVRRETHISPAAKLERYIEARYLAQGENTDPAGDLSSFPAFAASLSARAESVNVAAGEGGAAVAASAAGGRPWRLQCYRSRGVMEDGSHLRLYFLQAADFEHRSPASGETRIEMLGDRNFLARTPAELRAVYQKVVTEASTRMGPAIHVEVGMDVSLGEDLDISGAREGQSVETVHLFIAHKAGSTHSYFSATPDVYRWHGLAAITKNVEVFSNGVIVFGFRLRTVDLARAMASSSIFTPSPQGFGLSNYAGLDGVSSLDLNAVAAATAAAAATTTQRPPPHPAAQSSGVGARQPSSASLLMTAERQGAALDSLRERRSGGAGASSTRSLGDRLRDLVRDVALHFVLPRTSLTPLLNQGLLSAQEIAYAYCGWKFAYHFLNRMTTELDELNRILRASIAGDASGEAMGLLSKIRKQVQSKSFTESAILEALYRYPDVLAYLFDGFQARLKPYTEDALATAAPAGAAGRASPTARAPSRSDVSSYLRKAIKSSEEDLSVFEMFATFNAAVQRTNFFRRDIVALSFRLDPTLFLDKLYADVPYGVYMVVGAEFRGFHTRFADVARGGIRLIRSTSAADFSVKLAGLFDEGYSLAHTQQRKNKDLPEGGSKGVVLLSLAHQDKAKVAFKKYIDALLDLMMVPRADVVDLMPRTSDGSPKQEILFLGPDEGTADLMDWACEHARSRGYAYWKAFTTGKSPRLGGVPHDTYGMTTRGVREFVTGLQRKLGMEAKAAAGTLTKLQTGGPDGDLGSNEILLANERTVGIVDGSGVAFDPAGLCRAEIVRLATERKMVNALDVSTLGPQGFVVLVGDTDVKLPGGTLVPSGMAFRNNFHLNALASADLFVPCGGRPQAVNADNVEAFAYGADPAGSSAPAAARADGKRVPRFTAIVEGANLFLTQDARLYLEAKGVVVVKDASANKGGVCSSSLEVLAALALSDAEFTAHMQVPPGGPTPAFYTSYVAETQARIADNARAEFEGLWLERERAHEPLSLLSDRLSNKITELSFAIEASESLWANKALVRSVLAGAIPACLLELVGGLDVCMGRLPVNYQRALFAARLASRFIYEKGIAPAEFAFYEYVGAVAGGAN